MFNLIFLNTKSRLRCAFIVNSYPSSKRLAVAKTLKSKANTSHEKPRRNFAIANKAIVVTGF